MRYWHGLLLETRAHGREIPTGDKNRSNVYHDALEFPDGKIVLLTHLCKGQRATVLQLPASPRVTVDERTVRFDRRVADYSSRLVAGVAWHGCTFVWAADLRSAPALRRRHSMQEHKNEQARRPL